MKKTKINRAFRAKMSEMFTQKWAESWSLGSYHISAEKALMCARLSQTIRLIGWVGGLMVFLLSVYLTFVKGTPPATTMFAGFFLAIGIIAAAYGTSRVPANTAQLAHDWKKVLPEVRYVLRHSPTRSEVTPESIASRINSVLTRLAHTVQLMEKEGDHRSERVRKRFGHFYNLARDLGLEPDRYEVYFGTLVGGLPGMIRVPEPEQRTIRINTSAS